MDKRLLGIISAVVVIGVILALTLRVSVDVDEPVVDAKPLKKADITTYKIARVGDDGAAGELFKSFVNGGGKVISLPDKADSQTLVILSEEISKEKAEKLIKEKAKVLFVGPGATEFAAALGEPVPEAEAFGYKIRPADALCQIDHDRVPCGNSESVLVMAGDVRAEDLEQSVLEWMGDE